MLIIIKNVFIIKSMYKKAIHFRTVTVKHMKLHNIILEDLWERE